MNFSLNTSAMLFGLFSVFILLNTFILLKTDLLFFYNYYKCLLQKVKRIQIESKKNIKNIKILPHTYENVIVITL